MSSIDTDRLFGLLLMVASALLSILLVARAVLAVA